MSQPPAVSTPISCRVALTSEVSVVVIDWTEIGKSLPTPTDPTWSWRVLRRSDRTGGGRAGIPSATVTLPAYLPRVGHPHHVNRHGEQRYGGCDPARRGWNPS